MALDVMISLDCYDMDGVNVHVLADVKFSVGTTFRT